MGFHTPSLLYEVKDLIKGIQFFLVFGFLFPPVYMFSFIVLILLVHLFICTQYNYLYMFESDKHRISHVWPTLGTPFHSSVFQCVCLSFGYILKCQIVTPV